jgi:uncharacterized membrane protein YgcG
MRAPLFSAALVFCSLLAWSASADVAPPVTCPSAGDAAGAGCTDDMGDDGVCVDTDGGTDCVAMCSHPDTACTGLGSIANYYGYCLTVGSRAFCVPSDVPCKGAKEGAACTFEVGTRGTCVHEADASGKGYLCRVEAATSSSSGSSSGGSSRGESSGGAASSGSSSSCSVTPGAGAASLALLGGMMGAVVAVASRRRRGGRRTAS